MGHWGVSIKSNDTFADIYADFFELYNEGQEPKVVSEKIKEKYSDLADDYEDGHNFWFTLAQAQWDCKALQNDVYSKVKGFIDSGQNLDLWRELGADEKEIEKRKDILEKFLAQLETERPEPKKRKKKIIRRAIYEKGDCLSFVMNNGKYAGAIVLEAVHDTELGSNLILATRINLPNQPTISDFENSELLICNYGQWKNRKLLIWIDAKYSKRFIDQYQVVAKVKVNRVYKTSDSDDVMYGGLDAIKEQTEMQFNFEQDGGQKPSRIKSGDYLTEKKWGLW